MNQVTLQNEKVGLLEKGAYALTNIGNIPVMTLISSFLLIFYTDVIGLNPAAVATLFLIARLLDGVSDPIMGFIVDHLPKTKWGRFRPYLIIGAILCSINFLLLWFGPLLMPEAKLVIVYISYLLIGITFDLMDIPLNSMLPVMTSDLKQRNSLSTIKGISYIIGGTIVSIVAPLVLAKAATPAQGYRTLVIGAVLVIFVFSILGALGIKERIQPIAQEKYNFKDLFPIMKERPILIMFITQLFFGASFAISGATAIFYAMYVLDNKPEVLSMVGMLSLVGVLPASMIAGYLTNKFGKRVVYTIGLLIPVLFGLMRLFDVTDLTLLYACTVLGALGTGLVMPLTYGIQADNVDYVEWKRNQRAEGALSSLNSFLVKAGMGIGGALPGYILAATGYVPNAVQTPSAINGIILVSIVIPALLFLIGAIIFYFGYNLDRKKMEEVVNSLRERRAENGGVEGNHPSHISPIMQNPV